MSPHVHKPKSTKPQVLEEIRLGEGRERKGKEEKSEPFHVLGNQ